jgi:hypothetical protein
LKGENNEIRNHKSVFLFPGFSINHNTMDTSESYQTQIIIKSSQERIFQALTKDIGQWWGETDGKVSAVEDTFTVSWGEPWYMFKIV